MEQFIGCDAHKKFSVFVAVNEKGQAGEALRVAHARQLYREFLEGLPAHSTIRTDPAQARRLAEDLGSHGVQARVIIYPDYGHQIPMGVRNKEIDPFIDAALKSK